MVVGTPGVGREDMPAAIGARLEAAAFNVHRDHARAEAELLAAQQAAPDYLPAYYALYKFYFYRHRLQDARQIALQGLRRSAALGGFDADWKCLDAGSADWRRDDGAVHFYLFTLKALAFISLRSGEPQACRELLDKLAELDPGDLVGASVIRELAAGAAQTDGLKA